MPYTLTLTDSDDEALRQAVLAPLRVYNLSQAGASGQRQLAVLVHDDQGQVVGGAWGYTGFQWLFIQLLVVPADARGQGLGTQIMQRAEAEAVERGCVGAWLDTFEFQARGFYEKLGYTCFGQIDDYPPGFARYFMKKALAPVQPAP
ncbi:GNAT family N-acetyltransferase [Rhizobacter sp. SG703]|uniref:GNAT family N-acetyltransferase n=1 Tax=Rhizobacter sp. SG703 TaxID=2587140 RepID=UPI001447BBE9|nr:GNAT family N-acetyltransferase [Rhizobacter sp. SG703]NKI94259.1 GNAT superfamily N-acetyltransferase [Rhizobacter sp. SG703]